jgi:acyl carrier protein
MDTAPCISEIESILINEAASLLSMPPEQVTGETPLLSLGIDSLRLFELVVFIEKKFGINLLDAPLGRRDLENIRALSQHIAARLQG